MRVAVIGAGLAGVTAAETLQDHGHDVVVFEKSRGVGGRTAVRRHDLFAFDHGAQYFTVRDHQFRERVAAWIEEGAVARWHGRIATIGNHATGAHVPPAGTSPERYVGVPGMNAPTKHLAAGLEVVARTRVSQLSKRDAGWELVGEAGADLGRFDAVVVALPYPQSAELLATIGEAHGRIPEATMAPCWAVLLGCERSLDVPFDAAFVNDSPLRWIARNNSKPGRPSGESWVLHAEPTWSTRHLEQDPHSVIEALSTEFRLITGLKEISAVYRDAHRWRFALPKTRLDHGCFGCARQRWVVCGDWCLDGRVEGAFLSGLAAAERLLGVAAK